MSFQLCVNRPLGWISCLGPGRTFQGPPDGLWVNAGAGDKVELFLRTWGGEGIDKPRVKLWVRSESPSLPRGEDVASFTPI